MYKVTWNTNLGPVWVVKSDDELMDFLSDLAMIGFTANVEMLDTPDEN